MKQLIVGNWKMHLTTHEASLYLHHLSDTVKNRSTTEVVLCPSMLSIQSLSLQADRRQFKLGAQNCYWRDDGAYTGEVSATMLRGVVDYVIVGHSERRYIFREHDRDIRSKVQAVLRNKMTPILCIGETARERADGDTKHVIHDQVVSGLANVTSEEIKNVVIAYEPVWAIGTGENARPRDVERAAALIYRQVKALYGKEAADGLRILYGGSVTADNAGQYLGLDHMNGMLIGGASLDAHAFAKIIDMAHTKRKQLSIKKEGEA